MAQKKKKKKAGKKAKASVKQPQKKQIKKVVDLVKKVVPALPSPAKAPEKIGRIKRLVNFVKEKIQKRQKRNLAKKLRKPIIIVFSILALAVIFYTASIIMVFSLYNKAMPGTTVAGVDVSALTLDEIQNKLMDRGQPFLESSVPVMLDGVTQNFTPQELGISLLPRNTIQEIRFVNLKNSNIATISAAMIMGEEIPFHVSVDIEKAQRAIEERFAFNDKKSKDAYLTFENETLTVVPEKPGKAIDIRELYKDIKNRANSLSSESLTIKIFDQQPLVTKEKLEAEMEKIKARLYEKIYLTYESWDWNFKLADHVDWIKFEYQSRFHVGDVLSLDLGQLEEDPGALSAPLSMTKDLQITIEPAPFLAYVETEINPVIETQPQDVSLSKDENGEIIIEGKGENGQTIKDEYLISALNLAINKNIDEVPIPVQIKKAHVEVSEDLKSLGIETLIGTGRSAFAGSPPNRIHNINVGINKYNGLLIAPGETFSFNEFVGPVDASGGYLPELVIKAEGTIPEYGGGLCQVSSTIYHAALVTGLPIVERSPHSYAVSYYAQIYGYGLDATIYIGIHDVRFINDTPGHILIQAYTDGTQAYFKFYGTDDGRTVELEGPYQSGYYGPGPAIVVENPAMAPGTRVQVAAAHTGFNVTWYRHLVKGGEKLTETIYSAYNAIPAKVMVGPGVAEEPAAE
ncbi:hypothetical protein C0416_02385 [bacterium]|nr:hypothetical protein [bacterium]